jgi:hypothetical protein
MRIVTEVSESNIFIQHVNMTEDEKLLLKDFEDDVVDPTIERFANELDKSKQFGEHTDAVIELLYNISKIIRDFKFGYDSYEEHNKDVQFLKDYHKKESKKIKRAELKAKRNL